MKSNYLLELKKDIFYRAKLFIDEMGEFAPFGTKLTEGEIKDVVFYNDKSETLNTGEALKIIQENLIKELNNKEIHVGAYAYDVSANFKNADGISEKRDALCLKISTDGENWSEEYFPYMVIDGECVWR